MPEFTPEQREAAKKANKETLERRQSPEELLKHANLDLLPPAEAKVLDRIKQMPAPCRLTYVKAMRGNSHAAAIKAFCQMCMGWHKAEVPLCTDPACPLFPYRPEA